jgi:hypothetical protein
VSKGGAPWTIRGIRAAHALGRFHRGCFRPEVAVDELPSGPSDHELVVTECSRGSNGSAEQFGGGYREDVAFAVFTGDRLIAVFRCSSRRVRIARSLVVSPDIPTHAPCRSTLMILVVIVQIPSSPSPSADDRADVGTTANIWNARVGQGWNEPVSTHP